jgi:hypothetical protein
MDLFINKIEVSNLHGNFVERVVITYYETITWNASVFWNLLFEVKSFLLKTLIEEWLWIIMLHPARLVTLAPCHPAAFKSPLCYNFSSIPLIIMTYNAETVMLLSNSQNIWPKDSIFLFRISLVIENILYYL